MTSPCGSDGAFGPSWHLKSAPHFQWGPREAAGALRMSLEARGGSRRPMEARGGPGKVQDWSGGFKKSSRGPWRPRGGGGAGCARGPTEAPEAQVARGPRGSRAAPGGRRKHSKRRAGPERCGSALVCVCACFFESSSRTSLLPLALPPSPLPPSASLIHRPTTPPRRELESERARGSLPCSGQRRGRGPTYAAWCDSVLKLTACCFEHGSWCDFSS